MSSTNFVYIFPIALPLFNYNIKELDKKPLQKHECIEEI